MSATNPNDNLAVALQEVTENVTRLVKDEIELAKAEVTEKVTGLAAGAAAVAVGGVLGFFAIVYVFLTIAWVLNAITGTLWVGFLVVTVLLLLTAGGAVLFAIRKFKKASPPTPTMAIDEAKKIRETVTAATASSNGAAINGTAVNGAAVNGSAASTTAVTAGGHS
jgi:uncharacterized membrane protein YqjE